MTFTASGERKRPVLERGDQTIRREGSKKAKKGSRTFCKFDELLTEGTAGKNVTLVLSAFNVFEGLN